MSVTIERGEGICDNCDQLKNLVYLCNDTGPHINLCIDCVAKLIWPVLEEENEEYV